MDVLLYSKRLFASGFTALCFASITFGQELPAPIASDPLALPPAEVQPPTQQATQQPLPNVVQGPAGSQLVGVQRSPSYTSSLGALLGLDTRESTDSELSQYYNSNSRRRVSRLPEMFGDFRRFSAISSIDGEVDFNPPPTTPPPTTPPTNNINEPSTLEVPNAGGISGLKIGENNQTITSNRLWFSYNRMYDAIQAPTQNGFRDINLDRFTVGCERVLRGGGCSIEARLPLAGTLSDDLNFDPGVIGDLSLIFKKLLYADGQRATAIGIGVELPTGDDSRIWTNSLTARLDSDTVFLVPYLATTRVLSDVCFMHFFSQLTIPTGEDDLYINYYTNGPRYGSVRAPLTTAFDLALGRWVVQPSQNDPSGLALLIEGHYLHTLDNGEVDVDGVQFNQSTLNSIPDNLLNITSAVHAQMNRDIALRVGYSLPVTDDEIFDSELIFQILHSR